MDPLSAIVAALVAGAAEAAKPTAVQVVKDAYAGRSSRRVHARLDALPMRQKLARTISTMRDMQAELLWLTI